MSFEVIITAAIVMVAYCVNRKFEDKDREISDLKEELSQVKRELYFEQSSTKHENELYDSLLKNYYKVLETYNIPVNWESLEAEEENEADEDDEDEQMVEIFVKDKNGTRAVKVPTKCVSFKRR